MNQIEMVLVCETMWVVSIHIGLQCSYIVFRQYSIIIFLL